MSVGRRNRRRPHQDDRSRGGESGAISPYAFILLLALSGLAVASAVVLSSVSAGTRGTSERVAVERALVAQSEKLSSFLASDPTPDSDSPTDPVWRELGSGDWNGCVMRLRDVSSGINPNWVQRNLLTETGLGELLLKPGKTADELQVYRSENGFFHDIGSGYADFFHDDALTQYLTPYGYANVNVSDEFALEELAFVRSGDRSSAEFFHERLREAVADREVIDSARLEELLGQAYGSVYPVVNAEPAYNAHFLPGTLLRAVLSYPAFGVRSPESRAEYLLSVRGSTELTAESLANTIGVEPPHRVYQYLGTVTWFWEITAEKDGTILRTVLARLPSSDTAENERPSFRVVEKRILE